MNSVLASGFRTINKYLLNKYLYLYIYECNLYISFAAGYHVLEEDDLWSATYKEEDRAECMSTESRGYEHRN